MINLIGTLGGAIVGGISNYFNTKQEIKKVKVEAEKKVIVAEAEAKITRMMRESEQDFGLDKLSVQDMRTSWKDELVLLIFLIPLVLSFVPEYQHYVEEGFKALEKAPDWYMAILIGMIVVIYGMRGLLRKLLEFMLTKGRK